MAAAVPRLDRGGDKAESLWGPRRGPAERGADLRQGTGRES